MVSSPVGGFGRTSAMFLPGPGAGINTVTIQFAADDENVVALVTKDTGVVESFESRRVHFPQHCGVTSFHNLLSVIPACFKRQSR